MKGARTTSRPYKNYDTLPTNSWSNLVCINRIATQSRVQIAKKRRGTIKKKTMTKIKYLAAHHAGGLGNNRLASTQHLTADHINNAHQRRWPYFKSELNYWIGYNALLFPDGRLLQTRLIGEPTAAQKKHNEDTFSICVIGNHTKDGFGNPVDKPTEEAKAKLRDVGLALLDGDPERVGLKMKAGTVLDIKIENVVPHRFLQWTECYGSALSDAWARDLMKAKIEAEVPATEDQLEEIEVLTLTLRFLQLRLTVLTLMRKLQMMMQRPVLGGKAPISCIDDEDVMG